MSVLDPARKTGTMNTTFKSQDRSVKGTSVVEWCEPRVCDLPAGTIGIVTASYDQREPKSPTDAEKKILSLSGESSSGPVKAVLNQNMLIVGSGPSNDLVIDDMYVSNFHCRFFKNDGAWYVKDLDSTNGTFVNDEKITVKEIQPNDVVRVGPVNVFVLAGRKELDFPGYGGIISEDPAMRKVFEQIEAAASSDEPVLITGETGSGKGVVARAIHRISRRATKTFVAKNCSVLPKDLIDSELFGHKKGSFSGAHEDRIGLFEKASGGTLFLDEIGEIPAKLQARFLQAIEDKLIMRVGETETRRVDTRIVAATNRSVETMVGEDKFRKDLYFRISVFSIHVPPLRKRPKDIPLLARYLLATYKTDASKNLSRAAIRKLQKFDYQGNVRDLRNTIIRSAEMCKANTIGPEHIEFTPVTGAETYMESQTLDEAMKKYVLNAIENNKGNITRAARELGKSNSALYRLMERLGIEKDMKFG